MGLNMISLEGRFPFWLGPSERSSSILKEREPISSGHQLNQQKKEDWLTGENNNHVKLVKKVDSG